MMHLLSTSASAGGAMSLITPLIMTAILFLVFWLFLIRPQRKRDKVVANMRASIEVGDEVITAGGIIGRVVSIKEETILIETGADRCKIRILRSAVSQNNTAHEAPSEKK